MVSTVPIGLGGFFPFYIQMVGSDERHILDSFEYTFKDYFFLAVCVLNFNIESLFFSFFGK